MISGYTKIDENKSLFEYKDKILKVKYEGEKLLDNSSNILNCKKFPDYNDIYFYKTKEYNVQKGTNKYYPDLVINFKKNHEKISAINFELDELDFFYNVDLTDKNLDKFNVTGEMTVKAKPFNETDSNKYSIKVKEKNMKMQIIVGKSVDSSSTFPVALSKKIRIEYDFNNDYSLIYDTVQLIKKFISFIAYRRNIIFKKITMQSRNENDLLTEIGSIEYIDKTFIERKTDIKYIEGHSYFYENICNSIGTLFNKISSNEIDILNIPKDDYMINVYNEERILMIASSFEDLFTLIYKDKITHKEESIKMRNYFLAFLESKETDLNLEKKEYRKFWDKIKRNVGFDNYSSKLNEVLQKENFINELIRKLNEDEGKKYERSKMTAKIENIRNKCAHGEYRKFAEYDDLICIKALELIVYYLQLKHIGVDLLNINIILYRVFRITVPSDILEKLIIT